MAFLLISFVAGLLTVLAPCILPLLPVVIGSSATGRSVYTPYIVVVSLALSIIAFTFLLKVSTALITIPPEVWTYLSGGILVLFGLTLVFPALWESVPGLAKLSASSNKVVGSGYKKKSFWGDVVIGAALGPVFSTCSPTYFVILASVLPASFALGTLYLLAYVLGLSLSLLALGLLGERLAGSLGAVANPRGWFKRSIGVFFVVLGFFIATGYEKKIETQILESGYFDVTKLEQVLLQNHATKQTETETGKTNETTMTDGAQVSEAGVPVPLLTAVAKSARYTKSPELVAPNGYLNTNGTPVTISEFQGKKVVLVDFWTYSCINCQRTTPYLNGWYDRYEKDGLVIIGVHTPEFGFEKVQENVKKAIEKEGIRYPVVLDNEYQTWNAFKNQYWPRKYLVDIDSYIVYDHIGEGAYEETEAAIRKALEERATRLNAPELEAEKVHVTPVTIEAQSLETYFGWGRNDFLGTGQAHVAGTQTVSVPDGKLSPSVLYLGGTWKFEKDYATSASADARIVYPYTAKSVYFVASAPSAVSATVLRDGVPVPPELRGEDIDATGKVRIKEARLYKLIQEKDSGSHTIEIKVEDPGLSAFTFTFG